MGGRNGVRGRRGLLGSKPNVEAADSVQGENIAHGQSPTPLLVTAVLSSILM
jgi:hypothetical protein